MFKGTFVKVEAVKDAENARFIGQELPVLEENSDGTVTVGVNEALTGEPVVVTSFVPTDRKVEEPKEEVPATEPEKEEKADEKAEANPPVASGSTPDETAKAAPAKPQVSGNQTKKK